MKAVTMKGKEIEAALKMVALTMHLMNVDFEARAEAELPERLLCCARLNRAVGAPERSEGWFAGLLG